MALTLCAVTIIFAAMPPLPHCHADIYAMMMPCLRFHYASIVTLSHYFAFAATFFLMLPLLLIAFSLMPLFYAAAASATLLRHAITLIATLMPLL